MRLSKEINRLNSQFSTFNLKKSFCLSRKAIEINGSLHL